MPEIEIKQLPDDHPAKIGFGLWKNLTAEGFNDYQYTRKHALSENHVDGALWWAYYNGFEAGREQ